MSAGCSTATVANAATARGSNVTPAAAARRRRHGAPSPQLRPQARADNASTDRAGALKVTSTMVCALLAALLAIVAARVRLRRVGAGTARPQRAMLAW